MGGRVRPINQMYFSGTFKRPVKDFNASSLLFSICRRLSVVQINSIIFQTSNHFTARIYKWFSQPVFYRFSDKLEANTSWIFAIFKCVHLQLFGALFKNPNFFVHFLLVRVFELQKTPACCKLRQITLHYGTAVFCFLSHRMNSVVANLVDGSADLTPASNPARKQVLTSLSMPPTTKATCLFCSFHNNDTSKVTSFVIGISSKDAAFLSFNTDRDDDMVASWFVFCAFVSRKAKPTPSEFVVGETASWSLSYSVHLLIGSSQIVPLERPFLY